MNKKHQQQSSHGSTDEQLFRQAVDGVVPLRTAATTDSKAPRTATGKRLREFEASSCAGSEVSQSTADIEHGNSHRKNGVQIKVMQKLKRGRFPPADQFDLHHLDTRSGKTALLKFIAASQQQGLTCVRVIHGKGLRSKDGPKLKHMTRKLLHEHSQVLAYTACKPVDGGDGATDVLLKLTNS